jgi:hypothetical protein
MRVKKYMISKVMNNKINNFVQVQQEIAMGCSCEGCGTADCDNLVEFFFTVFTTDTVAPVGTVVPIRIVEENLTCAREQCFVETTVPNPCNPALDIPCRACLNRYRYVGCIEYACNIPLAEGGFFICSSDCEFIDRIRCFSCSDVCFPCPPAAGFIGRGPAASIWDINIVPGTPFFQVTVRVRLTLTSPCTVA